MTEITQHPVMKRTRSVAWLIGFVCGAELALVAFIGGGGLTALFGLNGVIVATALGAVLTIAIRRRRHSRLSV